FLDPSDSNPNPTLGKKLRPADAMSGRPRPCIQQQLPLSPPESPATRDHQATDHQSNAARLGNCGPHEQELRRVEGPIGEADFVDDAVEPVGIPTSELSATEGPRVS